MDDILFRIWVAAVSMMAGAALRDWVGEYRKRRKKNSRIIIDAPFSSEQGLEILDFIKDAIGQISTEGRMLNRPGEEDEEKRKCG